MESALKAATAEERIVNKAAFLHVLSSLVGSGVKVTTEKHVVGGVFYTATPYKTNNFLVAIKGDGNEIEKGVTTLMQGNEWISVESKKLDLSPKTELQTDSAIRGKDISHLEGRDLVSAADWVSESPLANLESAGGVGSWNQFDANAKLKDYKKIQFDENLYTKRLDMSSMSAAQIKRAEQIAREIESQVSNNIHMQEERGHALERDIDEEALYSGVIGTGGYAQGAPKGFNNNNYGHGEEAEAASWRRNQRPGAGPGPAQGQGQGKSKGPVPPHAGAGSPRGPGPAPGPAPQRAAASAPPPNAWGGDGLPAGVRGQAHAHADHGAGVVFAPPPGLSPVPSPQQSPRMASVPPVSAPAAAPAPAPAAAPAPASAATATGAASDGATGAGAVAEPKKQLSATAKEWKPNAAAASFVPKAALVPPQAMAGGPGMVAGGMGGHMGGAMHVPPPQVMLGVGGPMGMRPPFIPGPGYPPQQAGMPPPQYAAMQGAGGYGYEGADMGPPMHGGPYYPQPLNMPAGQMLVPQPMPPAGPYGGGGYPGPYIDQRGGYPDEFGGGMGGPYGHQHGGRGGVYNDYDRGRQGRGGGYGGGVGGGGGGGVGPKMRGRGGSRDYPDRPDYDDAYSRNNEMMRQGRERGASFQEDQGGDGAYHHQQQQQQQQQHHQQGIPPQMPVQQQPQPE